MTSIIPNAIINGERYSVLGKVIGRFVRTASPGFYNGMIIRPWRRLGHDEEVIHIPENERKMICETEGDKPSSESTWN